MIRRREDESRSGKRGKLLVEFGQSVGCFVQFSAYRLVKFFVDQAHPSCTQSRRLGSDRLPLREGCFQRLGVSQPQPTRIIINQVFRAPPPALDRIERRDGLAERQVFLFGKSLEFGQGEDVVVSSLPEPRRRDADVSGRLLLHLNDQRLISRICEVCPCVVDDHMPTGELWIVRNLDAKACRKTEPGRIGKIGRPGRDQHDLVDRRPFSQIDLHPFLDIGFRHDRAVITVRRAGVGSLPRLRQPGQLPPKFLQFAINRLDFRTGHFRSDRREHVVTGRKALFFDGQTPPDQVGGRFEVKRPVGAVDAGEDRLQSVILLLRDRVEFVVVAPSAVYRQALKSRHGSRHHVVAIVRAGDLLVERPFPQLDVPDEVPGAGRDETRRHDGLRVVGVQDITRQLLGDEAVVRLVGIECGDDVIAIRPGIRTRLVFVVAVRFAEMHHVEPVPSPALAVPRRIEQSVDQVFVGVLGPVRQKRCDFGGSGRQAGEIVGEPADERPLVSLGRRGQFLFVQFGRDERIDGRTNPFRFSTA